MDEFEFEDAGSADRSSEVKVESLYTEAERTFKYGVAFAGQKVQRIVGPPGTGKTTFLINLVVDAVESGVSSEDICFITFTNVAADEAISRIKGHEKLKDLSFPHFSTIHSLATRAGGNKGLGLVSRDHLAKFDSNIQVIEEWLRPGDAASVVYRPKHIVLDAHSLAINTKSKGMSFENWQMSRNLEILQSHFDDNAKAQPFEILADLYITEYEQFKKSEALVDFNDVVLNMCDENLPQGQIPSFKILIVDEAQDLTNLQWDFVARLAQNAEMSYLSGDDDQAIMEPFGASPGRFRRFPVNQPDKILEKSYRIPPKLKSWLDEKIIRAIEHLPDRIKKDWGANDRDEDFGIIATRRRVLVKNKDGVPNQPTWVEINIDALCRYIHAKQDEEWLIMAPTKATCETMSVALYALGVGHFLHRKDRLHRSNKIYVQTIHTSKGMDVENVALVIATKGDLFMIEDPKLRYVALTRAKKTLFPYVYDKDIFPMALSLLT